MGEGVEVIGVRPGSEVEFSQEGGRIVIPPVASALGRDRRARLCEAAAKARESVISDFRKMGADDITEFLRGDHDGDGQPIGR
jgi:antitoxin component of MazEF toxin-antitoxin module